MLKCLSSTQGFHIFPQGTSSGNNQDSVFGNGPSHSQTPLAPIGSKPRHYSGNTLLGGQNDPLGLNLGSIGVGSLGSYHKAPGSEREDREANLKKQLAAIDSDPTLDPLEKNKRKQSLFLSNMVPSHPPVASLPVTLPVTLPVSMPVTPSSSFVSSLPSSLSSTVSPLAPPFYPTSDTVESVVGKEPMVCCQFF